MARPLSRRRTEARASPSKRGGLVEGCGRELQRQRMREQDSGQTSPRTIKSLKFARRRD